MGRRMCWSLVCAVLGVCCAQAQITSLCTSEDTAERKAVAEPPTPEMVDAECQRVAKKYEFTIGHAITTPTVTGDALSAEEAREQVVQFFAAIDIFPVRFLRETKLHVVVFCRDLMLRGQRAGGVATSDGVIYLNVPFRSHVIYHEMFHIADPVRQNPRWTKINPKGFTYLGNLYMPDADQTRSRGAAKGGDEAAFRKHFVSDYAMTLEAEDRAETFAWMVAQPQTFATLAKETPALAKKAELVKSIVRTFSPAMNRDFWLFIATSDDESRMADLRARAGVNDRRKKEKKAVLNSGYTR